MDEVMSLLAELAQLDVSVAAENGLLKISAAKGVLTGDLRRRLQESKEQIVRRLERIGEESARRGPARIVPDPASDHLPFPLSDLQLGFYMANDPYMEFHVRPHFYMEFDHTDFDLAAYEAAWNKALERHRRELCRVSSDIELQLLEGTPRIACEVYDLRELSQDEARERLLSVRAGMQRQELPLDSWPWLDLRVSLWREGGRERARVHYNHNNYFVDGVGTMQLLAEIDGYYRDPALSLPPLEPSYRDAILGLERLAESEAGRQAREYWFSRLPDLPPPPPVPQTGLNRRCRSHLQGRERKLEKPLWDAFKSRASSLGITPTNAVTAAYAYVISTWSNADHFIFSQMVTRRFPELHPDLPRMMGNFVSLYPLEVRLLPAASFAENAKRIQSRVLEDVRHLQIGGMRVLQELNRMRGSFGSAPSPFVVGSGLVMKTYKKADYGVLETSQTLLDHQFFERPDGGYHYVWDLLEEFFPAGVIDAMWDAFHGLLRRLSTDEAAWHQRDFALVGDSDLSERRERNRTARPVSSARLHDPLREQAGDRTVLISSQGSLSYGRLQAWSAALAAELSARGVGRGHLVPVVMDRDREILAAVLAVLKTGAAYVPIDPRLPRERLALLLEDVGASVVLTQPRYRASIEWPDRVTPLSVAMDGAGAADEIVAGVEATDLAYVIYTSGSTGRPKGVMIDHRGAMNTIEEINERFGIGPSDRIFGVSAFNFDLSVYDIFGTVAAGAGLIYPDPESSLDPGHWLDLMLREGVTVWSSVPALMSLLVEAAERREAALPALRLVLLSGDKIPLGLPDAVRRVAPGARVVSLGGATEASIWSIFFPVEEVDPGWSTIPYGHPLSNQPWEVRDRHGNPCPTWVPGELWIGGVGLALGYWNDPEKTSRSFQPDPSGSSGSETGGRLYRTGDLGRYLPGGCIEWMGRADFQVKIQGHRIELGEIEAALAEHPSVRHAVVAVAEAAGAHRRLVGYVVPAEDAAVDPRQLEAFLRAKLPAYMVPAAWRAIDRLPLSGNGKIDRKALLALRLDGATESEERREHAAPANAVESRLQAIWESILGLSGIGVTDDFFDLGGQSFDAIRIFALIKEEFGTAFTLGDLWRARTIRALGQEVSGGAGDGERAGGGRVVPIDLAGTGEPLFLVHPAGGSVMTYFRLGRLLERPLYGIQASTSPGEASRRDIGELARGYVAELRSVQAGGPYSVGGWSSGAMIAFEMAAQLEAAGEEVRQVFILDGPAPFEHEDLSDGQLLRWFLEDLALDLPVERLHGVPLGGLTLDGQLRAAAQALEVRDAAGLELEQLAANFEVFRDLVAAGSRYRPRTIAAGLTVVRVEHDVVDEFAAHPHRQESDWGWSGFTRGPVRSVRVPGTHHTFLTEPLVEGWCSLLSETELSEVEPAVLGRT